MEKYQIIYWKQLKFKLKIESYFKTYMKFIFKIDLLNVEVILWLRCVWLADVRSKSRFCFDWKIFTIKININSKLVGTYNLQKINEPCSNALMQRTPNGNIINAQYLTVKRLAIFKFLQFWIDQKFEIYPFKQNSIKPLCLFVLRNVNGSIDEHWMKPVLWIVFFIYVWIFPKTNSWKHCNKI